jgi:hypothetical protein
MTRNDEVELNEARLQDIWGVWQCATAKTNVPKWIAAHTAAQARDECLKRGWKWDENRIFGMDTARKYARSEEWVAIGIDVILP